MVSAGLVCKNSFLLNCCFRLPNRRLISLIVVILVELAHLFGQVNFVDDEFVCPANVVVFATDLGNVAVDVVDFSWPSLAKVLVH